MGNVHDMRKKTTGHFFSLVCEGLRIVFLKQPLHRGKFLKVPKTARLLSGQPHQRRSSQTKSGPEHACWMYKTRARRN